jgi:hypothetical protein
VKRPNCSRKEGFLAAKFLTNGSHSQPVFMNWKFFLAGPRRRWQNPWICKMHTTTRPRCGQSNFAGDRQPCITRAYRCRFCAGLLSHCNICADARRSATAPKFKTAFDILTCRCVNPKFSTARTGSTLPSCWYRTSLLLALRHSPFPECDHNRSILVRMFSSFLRGGSRGEYGCHVSKALRNSLLCNLIHCTQNNPMGCRQDWTQSRSQLLFFGSSSSDYCT